MNNIDDMISKLEKKLLESQQDSTLENNKWSIPVKNKNTKKYTFPTTKIHGNTVSQKKLYKFEQDVQIIENSLEEVSDDIEKLKELIQYEKIPGPKLSIDFNIEKPKITSIREIRVTLDGYTVFSSSKTSVPWRPKEEIPIFNGPIKTGLHKIEITGFATKSIDQKISIEDDIIIKFNESHDLRIKGNNCRFSINLSSKNDDTNEIQVKLIEL